MTRTISNGRQPHSQENFAKLIHTLDGLSTAISLITDKVHVWKEQLQAPAEYSPEYCDEMLNMWEEQLQKMQEIYVNLVINSLPTYGSQILRSSLSVVSTSE